MGYSNEGKLVEYSMPCTPDRFGQSSSKAAVILVLLTTYRTDRDVSGLYRTQAEVYRLQSYPHIGPGMAYDERLRDVPDVDRWIVASRTEALRAYVEEITRVEAFVKTLTPAREDSPNA